MINTPLVLLNFLLLCCMIYSRKQKFNNIHLTIAICSQLLLIYTYFENNLIQNELIVTIVQFVCLATTFKLSTLTSKLNNMFIEHDLKNRIYIGIQLLFFAIGSIILGKLGLTLLISYFVLNMCLEVFLLKNNHLSSSEFFLLKSRGLIHALSLLTALMFILHEEYVLIVFCATIFLLNDIGAYFIGKYFLPKEGFWAMKLAPKISPNKKLFASLGGIAFALIIHGSISAKIDISPWFTYDVFPAIIIISVLNIMGDLHASSIKRRLEIKDYPGATLMKHGGYLDRFDSWGPGFLGLTISIILFSKWHYINIWFQNTL